MIQLVIHESAAQLGIIHPVACIIQNVSVSSSPSTLDIEIAGLVQQLHTETEIILSRPEVHGFKELFARMGYPKQTPAGHRLIEGLQRRGFKSYNNIVDAYNITSALFGSGLGMHDAAAIIDDIHVFRADGNERIIPLFKTDPVDVTKGDLVYSTGGRLVAWLGKRDVDSEEFKVQDNTTTLLLVALGNEATAEEYNKAVCLKTLNLIQRTCSNATAHFLNVVHQ